MLNEKFYLFLKQHALKRTLIPYYLSIILFIIINAVISLVRPKMQGNIVDKLSLPETTIPSEFFRELSFFLILLLASYVITYLQKYIASLTSEEIAADLRQSVHNKLGTVDPAFYHNIKLSDILQKADKDILAIKQCSITSIITLISNITIVLAVTPYMFLIHKEIALSNVVLLICIPVISKKIGSSIQKSSDEVLKGYNDVTSVLNDSYNNWFIIRLFQCYEYMNTRYFNKNQRYKKNTNRQNLLYVLNTIIILAVQFLGTVIIWALGAKEIFEGRMTIGTIMTLMNYQAILMNPIVGISSFTNDYHTAVVALKDIYQLFDYGDLEENKIKLKEIVKSIDVQNISFRYRDTDKFIFQNFDLHFETGKIYAISGKSGQGKSTLFQLISGILKPVKGVIRINGTDLNQIDYRSFWKKLGYVMQTSSFFEDSVLQNINLTNLAALEQVEEICRELDLYEDIHGLTEDWNTILKTDPANFSEGQLRRMDIARNLLKFPDVLIFDEPTSNIDKKRCRQFFEILHRLEKNKIIIITTHNPEELNQADIIYDLNENGMVSVGKAI